MKNITDLPSDLVEEVLCRIPLTSLRKVRSTCKKFNSLSKHKNFAKKHLDHQERGVLASKEKEFIVIVMMQSTVYLMRVNLHNNKIESSIKRQGRLIVGLEDSYKIYDMFHCNGLFLCITEDNSRHMVWHPYLGLNRWIESTHKLPIYIYCYAFGYDKSTESHKILRGNVFGDFKIYDFNSDSWRDVDVVSLDWNIHYFIKGLSLKGNTYWVAHTKSKNYSVTRPEDDNFLICFDFTRETFGPHLPLPFLCSASAILCLSSVREEQLVILFQDLDTLRMEIWVTTKIESNEVSWNTKFFLEADIKQLIHPHYQFKTNVSFFIDEDKKVVVVFDRDKDRDNPSRFICYIIGVDGSFKQVVLVEEIHWELTSLERLGLPRCSYVSKLNAT